MRHIFINAVVVFVFFCDWRLAVSQSYIAIDLYKIGIPANNSMFDIPDYPSIANAGNVGGHLDGNFGAPYEYHAALWTGPNGNVVDLHPTNLPYLDSSEIRAVHGNQQVGDGYSNAANRSHALLWNGSAGSAIDLDPVKLGQFSYSSATNTNGTQQVGYGYPGNTSYYHALVWTGTADSAVDLNPTNIIGAQYSIANGTDGIHQVGFASGENAAGNFFHAMLWSGTANSAIDLNPTKLSQITGSNAYATRDGQQVGEGSGEDINGNSFNHAMVWNGTADSAVDLNPTNLTGFQFQSSFAVDTDGVHQVGYGGGIDLVHQTNIDHALLWSGTADSTVDLHSFLSPQFVESRANTIDDQGNIFGTARELDRTLHAIEWSPVPEPTSISLFVIVLGLLLVLIGVRRA